MLFCYKPARKAQLIEFIPFNSKVVVRRGREDPENEWPVLAILIKEPFANLVNLHPSSLSTCAKPYT
jgi:hypothetical protein